MACVISAGLTLDMCNSNNGGIQKIYIQNFDEGRTFTTGTGASASYITAMSGTTASFYTYELPKESSSITSTSTTDRIAGTTVVEQTAEFIIHSINSAILTQINILTKGIFRVMVLDSQGKYILIGKERGAVISAALASGKTYNEMAGGTLTVTAREPDNFYEVSPALASTWIQA